MDIKKFAKAYDKNYTWLYENVNTQDEIYAQQEYTEAFDNMMSESESFKQFVIEFCNYIGDLISSDREAAAFMLTLEEQKGN